MRKKQDRVDLEYIKPTAKFIEQFRMRVNGSIQEYKIDDKVEKKVKKNDGEKNNNHEDDYDVEHAQVIDQDKGEDEDQIDQTNKEFDIKKFKPQFYGKNVDMTLRYGQKKPQKIDDILKKNTKPTILSFEQDDY